MVVSPPYRGVNELWMLGNCSCLGLGSVIIYMNKSYPLKGQGLVWDALLYGCDCS